MILWLKNLDSELWTAVVFIALVGVGWGIGSTPLAVLAILSALTTLTLFVWQRSCLDGVSYRWALGASRAIFDDEVTLDIEIINDKLLPLSWLQAEEDVPAALRILGGTVSADGTYANGLVHFLPMLPYQRVRRSLTVQCGHRGAYTFGPARLTSGDPIGIRKRSIPVSGSADLLVYPKVFALTPDGIASRVFIGDERTRLRLFEDPSRIAGRRESGGGLLRDIDWRSSTTKLLVRQFEPTATLRVAVLFDVQVPQFGTGRWSDDPPEFEFAIAVTASFVAEFANRGVATGLFSSGTVAGRPIACPPSSSPAALGRMLEALARISASEVLAFSEVLPGIQREFRQGTSVVIVSADFSPSTMMAIAEIRRRHSVAAVWLASARGSPPAPELVDVLFKVDYSDDWQQRAILELAV